MVNKIDEICGSVTGNLADIVVITESWLTSLVHSSLIFLATRHVGEIEPTMNVVVDYVPSLARGLSSSNFVVLEILKLKASGLSLNPIVYRGESIP